MKFHLIALLAVLPLAACGATVDTNNAEYQLGYQDGCDSGVTYDPQFSKRVNRNEDMFKTSDMYRSGWKSGFSHCRAPTSPGGSGDIPGR